MQFKEQVIVITGAASGLGLAIAKSLLAEGARLAILDINVHQMNSEFAKYGDQVLLFHTDITEESKVQSDIQNVNLTWGRIDALVNSAGITGETNLRSHEVTTENLKKVFDLNFMASVYTSKAVLPIMVKRSYGRILHIASIAGKEGNIGMLAYSSSKAAVIGMTKVQGKEYCDSGITVNALAPAVIRTALVDAMPEPQVKYMTDKIPMRRCGTLEEAVSIVKYIISKENSFTTGFTYDLSGGRATY